MDYDALFNAAIYDLGSNVRVFAGTTDDPFWIDLGATFDTLNLRSTVAPGILSPAQDASDQNFASDTVSGYSVNSIAIEVPVTLLTRTGSVEPATSTAATIGMWATTSRPRTTVRRAPLPAVSSGTFNQVQRFGNALINELVIGIGSKDRFSMDQPKNDSSVRQLLPRSVAAAHHQCADQRGASDPGSAAHRSAAARDLRGADRRVRHAVRSSRGHHAAEHRRRADPSGTRSRASDCWAETPPAIRTAGGWPTTWSTSRCGWWLAC